MIVVAVIVVLALLIACIADEFRHGGSLSLLGQREDRYAEFTLCEGWNEHDVLTVLAEIEAL